MSEKKSEQSTSVTETTQAQIVQNQPNTPHSSKSSSKGLSILAILLSLTAIGGSGYNWYSQNRTGDREDTLLVGVNQIGTNVSVLAERMSLLEREQQQTLSKAVSSEQLKTGMLEVNNKVDLKLRDIDQMQVDLTETIERLSADLQRGTDELALDEVSQLLKMANNSAVFSGDKSTAINALQLADIQLKEMADPRFSVVRRQINQEVALLQSTRTSDVSSLTGKLHAIARMIPNLPLENEPPVVADENLVEREADSEEWTFRGELRKVWVDIVNSIKVHRIDQPPKPLLVPEQRYFLNQNLQLFLNKAELAALKNQQEVYQRSIRSATEWLNDYFDLDNAEVKHVLAELATLESEPIGVELPSIAGSYDALQQIKGGQ